METKEWLCGDCVGVRMNEGIGGMMDFVCELINQHEQRD